MVVGTLVVTLHIPDCHSLKEKRHVVRSLLARLRQAHAVAAAEVAEQDVWQTAVLGIACVSSDARHADEMCQKVLRFVEAEAEAEVGASHFELVHI